MGTMGMAGTGHGRGAAMVSAPAGQVARARTAGSAALTVTFPPSCPQPRWSILLRLPLAVPVLGFAGLLNIGAAPATATAALVTGHVPGWLADFQLRVLDWHLRSAAYLLLLTGRCPRLADPPAYLRLRRPPRVSRWKAVLWKFATALPHLAVLAALLLLLAPASMIGWGWALATGIQPAWARAFTQGTLAWYARVAVYLQSLTDEFPPYSLRTAARPGRRPAYAISAIAGGLPCAMAGSFVAFVAVFIVGFSGTHVAVQVPYDTLRAGHTGAPGSATVESGQMTLLSAHDPARITPFTTSDGTRFIAFSLSISNSRGAGQTVPVRPEAFRLLTPAGHPHAPVLVGLGNRPGPGQVPSGHTGIATIVFQLPRADRASRLVWDVVDYIPHPRRGETIEWIFT
jgi:Domain of unknown function (DUF4389)